MKFETIFTALFISLNFFLFQFLALSLFLFPPIPLPFNSIFMSPSALSLKYFLASHIHFHELLIELLECFGFLLGGLNSRCISLRALVGSCWIYCVHVAIDFLAFLLFPVLILFLVLFIFYMDIHYLFPRIAYLLSVFSNIKFSCFFFISPSFLQGSEYLCIFP